MDGYKHYIRIQRIGNEDIIVHRFSTGFLKEAGGNEEILPGDICVNEDGGRHYNDSVTNERGQYISRWDGTQEVPFTQEELDAEWASRPAPPPSDDDRIASIESAILSLMGL